MLKLMVIAFAHILLQVSACPEPITTVHIQNHDGPIYVSPSDHLPCDNQITIGSHGTCNRGTCNQGTCNQWSCNQGTCNQGTCNQGICNQGTCNQGSCNQGTCNQGTCTQGTCNQGTCTRNLGPCNRGTCNQEDSSQGTCNQGTCNQGTCNQGSYNPYSKTDNPLLHNSPYHLCETDCKCVTKLLSTSVPINTVPQNTCNLGTYYNYPDYSLYYNQGHPESRFGAGECPIAAEGIIPLLKSYLGQAKCSKQGCQCVQSYSTY